MSYSMRTSPKPSAGHSGGWATPWLSQEMLDGQRQRVDIPSNARTAHKGFLQKRLEEDLCRIIPHVSAPPLPCPPADPLSQGTELNCFTVLSPICKMLAQFSSRRYLWVQESHTCSTPPLRGVSGVTFFYTTLLVASFSNATLLKTPSFHAILLKASSFHAYLLKAASFHATLLKASLSMPLPSRLPFSTPLSSKLLFLRHLLQASSYYALSLLDIHRLVSHSCKMSLLTLCGFIQLVTSL